MTPPRNNILIITVESWRGDFAESHAEVPLTPRLARRNGQVRMPCWTTGPWTTPGCLSLLTGLSPLAHQILYSWRRPTKAMPSIVRTLRSSGYHCPNLCYLNGVGNYLNLGFEGPAPERADGPNSWLASRLRGLEQPFFGWYHYKFTHLPYWPPERYRNALGVAGKEPPADLADSVATGFVVRRDQHRIDPGSTDTIRRLYAAGVREFDDWLDQLLERLQDSGVLEHTLVLITADHGDELMERGHVGHASTSGEAHLGEELLRIPMIWLVPGRSGRADLSFPADLEDVAPTILGWAGISTPIEPARRGRDLSPWLRGLREDAPTSRGRYAHSARGGFPTPRSQRGEFIESLTLGPTKLVHRIADGKESWELRDLSIDPEENEAPETADPQHPLRLALARLRQQQLTDANPIWWEEKGQG